MLILFLDDMGTDQVSSWEEHPEAPPTPVLDALGDHGVRFANAYSYPVCSPARAALLTGRYGRRTGLGDLIEPDNGYELDESEVTIPEILPGSWSTLAVGKWHLSGTGMADWQTHALRQGFDNQRGIPGNVGEVHGSTTGKLDYNRWEYLEDGALSVREDYATSAQVDDTLEWIEGAAEPWLAYVAFNAAHPPYDVPPAHLVDGVKSSDPAADRYAAMVEALDAEIGRLFATMDPDLLGRTLVIAMGDNGTPADVVRPPRDGEQAKYTLYEGGTNVPLIVAGAGTGVDGEWSQALVHVVDVFPTVAEVAGVERVDVDGLSLSPLLSAPDGQWAREVLITERFGPNGPNHAREDFAARDARYKYMENWEAGELIDVQFFDLDGRDDDGPALSPATFSAEADDAIQRLSGALEAFRGE